MNIIKRPLISSLLILLCASYGAPQQTGSGKVEDNLYYRALLAGLDKMSKSYGGFSDYHNVIVERNYELTDGLPTRVGGSQVEYLDSQELINRYEKLKKEFPTFVLHSITTDGVRLNVGITEHWVSRNKKHGLSLGISDWSDVYFRYDCEKRAYLIDEVKLGGI